MSDKNTVSIQSLLRYSLPLGASLAAGDAETQVNWSVTIRAQPPAFPDVYGGELALVSMDVLRSFDSRLTLANVIRQLAELGVSAVVATGAVEPSAVEAANARGIALVSMPAEVSLTTVERAVNALILNQSARLTERAIEIQRQLTRLAAENRDLNSLLQVMARSTGKPIVIHDDTGTLMTQIYPNLGHRRNGRLAVVISHIIDILPEIGGQDNHLIPRVQRRPQYHIDGSGRPAAHHNIAAGKGQTGFPAQCRRYGGAGFRVAGVGHIAVHPRRRIGRQPPQFGVKLLRRLHYRIAQGQVKNFIRAVLGFQGDAGLEHSADPAALFHSLADVVGNGHIACSRLAAA